MTRRRASTHPVEIGPDQPAPNLIMPERAMLCVQACEGTPDAELTPGKMQELLQLIRDVSPIAQVGIASINAVRDHFAVDEKKA